MYLNSFQMLIGQELMLKLSELIMSFLSKPVVSGNLRKRKWLSYKQGEKNILIRFEVPEAENQWDESRYEPGDHLAVFPVNSDEDVSIVMEHLTNTPKEDEEVLLYEYNVRDGN